MNLKKKSIDRHDLAQRRRFLQLFSTAAALVPIMLITGCSDDPAPGASQRSEPQAPEPQAATPQTSAPEPEPEPTRPDPAQSAAEPSTGEMERLSLDNSTAQALGYKHDAAQIDTRKYAQYRSGQACANCTLFQGSQGDEWGGCTLFPGKLVNAKGWCSGYTPRPS